MAIVQYRTIRDGNWRYNLPSSTEVSQLTPAFGDWIAMRYNDDSWIMMIGTFDNGKFTGDAYTVDTTGINKEEYANEDFTIYNNYYVYSNMEGYREVNNISAQNVVGNFCAFLWVAIVLTILLGGALKCAKRVWYSVFSPLRRV